MIPLTLAQVRLLVNVLDLQLRELGDGMARASLACDTGAVRMFAGLIDEITHLRGVILDAVAQPQADTETTTDIDTTTAN